MIDSIKRHWRVGLLVVAVLAATVVLFAPQFAPTAGAEGIGADDGANGTADGLTNLQFGLDLDGGTRIRAPLVGYTATDVAFQGDDPATVASNVAGELSNTTSTSVNAELRDPAEGGTGAVEVTDTNVSETEFTAAIEAAGYTYEGVRPGVTEETREATIEVIEGKINEAGLSGGSVREIVDANGRSFVLIEVPGEDRQDVEELIAERGTVRIDIFIPNDGNGTRNRGVVTQDDFENVGTASRGQSNQAYVPVSVVDTAPEGQATPAQQLQQAVSQADAAAGNPGTDGWRCTADYAESEEPCLLLVVDGEVVNSFGMDGDLLRSMTSGSWANDPGFRLTTGTAEGSFERAQQISINLRAGALPAELGDGSSSYISPTQGEQFKTYSLITGILSVFAVAGMVFLRYREPTVALPMIVTALTEVYTLLGFAALLGYPLDLAVIAGFIAVVGTGVDDLVIIADEVMSEGDVSSKKVFDSRFRRAFWVIGAAAATTIIAMSPLMVLSLGDLSGFAIFTILGVLIGVLVTRPAYGDILRMLLTDR
ncbi:preprotein translocase subunit SecD [Halopenitus persicus]|uniref:Protein-export membrane protein SecD n=1 Tax=Halopenitus persicus TaxID=1048396 RepID=A0A1H3N247_9EURY|nr:preprotein translocase subunit SecD [Halopenitus persicus]QHS17755.1 preprotein translocase subunit SecD [haloarchaeon 3A1-DGR]SDY82962.1 preprotein translocase subunit SecD [Halopenitus persicus]